MRRTWFTFALAVLLAACSSQPPASDGGTDDAGEPINSHTPDAGAGDSGTPDAGADAGTAPDDLAATLNPIRTARSVPALGAAVVQGDALVALGATGVRKLGDPTPVTVDDLWHLGSNTKSMTATVAALLVQENELAWDDTLADHFHEDGGTLDPGYGAASIRHLFWHRAGMPANPPSDVWNEMWKRQDEDPQAVRAWAVSQMLSRAPPNAVGTFVYSNSGYMTAGRILERASQGTSWEALMEARLFAPLAMDSCGFGAPGAPTSVSQPWGHEADGATLKPVFLDNPPSLGPAGVVHCSLRDWAKYVSMHLLGARGEGSFLEPQSFTELHTPAPGVNYAMGWVVLSSPRELWHNGSNTLWYAEMRVLPQQNVGLLAVTNCGTKACVDAVQDTIAALRQEYAP